MILIATFPDGLGPCVLTVCRHQCCQYYMYYMLYVICRSIQVTVCTGKVQVCAHQKLNRALLSSLFSKRVPFSLPLFMFPIILSKISFTPSSARASLSRILVCIHNCETLALCMHWIYNYCASYTACLV